MRPWRFFSRPGIPVERLNKGAMIMIDMGVAAGNGMADWCFGILLFVARVMPISVSPSSEKE